MRLNSRSAIHCKIPKKARGAKVGCRVRTSFAKLRGLGKSGTCWPEPGQAKSLGLPILGNTSLRERLLSQDQLTFKIMSISCTYVLYEPELCFILE